MSLRLRPIVAVATLLATVALPAQAIQPGWYIGGQAGAAKLDDSDGRFDYQLPANASASASVDCTLNLLDLVCLLPNSSATTNITPGQRVSGGFGLEYDTGAIGGLSLGYAYENGWRVELAADYSQNDVESVIVSDNEVSQEGEMTAISLMANAWYDFNRDGDWHPYFGGGLGAMQAELQDVSGITIANESAQINDDDTVFAYQAGLGINYDVSQRFNLDLGYRFRGADDPTFKGNTQQGSSEFETEFQQHAVMIGMRYTFSPAARADSDGDGVADIYDQCPNTPKGAPVNADGCPLDSDGDGVDDYLDKCPGTPAGVPVNEDGCPKDSDGDGVPDYKDECPNTPKGVQVNDKGCPLVIDSDGDGVPDEQDLCPDTPPGQPVLTNGCAVGQSAVLQGVNFEFDSARLTPGARVILRETAQELKDSPGFQVEIAGHTDSLGSASYNRELSQQRADSVKAFLVAQGVNPARLDTMGYGESKPIAPNTEPDGSDNPEGRAMNRRVELSVIGER